MHWLDRPVWASLTHAPHIAEGSQLAKRFHRDVNVFASARDETEPCLAALGRLVLEGESVFVLQVPTICIPDALVAVRVTQGVQMVASRPIPTKAGDSAVVELGDADAGEMLALARLTEPGPFLARTHTMGRFLGVRKGGRLAAMAGERMRFPGFTEMSGVCTHPDFQGQGLASRLSSMLVRAIQRRGEQPFLHAWASNRPAITLYESLGFEFRTGSPERVLQVLAVWISTAPALRNSPVHRPPPRRLFSAYHLDMRSLTNESFGVVLVEDSDLGITTHRIRRARTHDRSTVSRRCLPARMRGNRSTDRLTGRRARP